MLKGSSPCIYFEVAAREYFIEEFTVNLLNMISAFDKLADKTSFPPTFTLALASVRYLLHRISLSSFDIDIQVTFITRLRALEGYVAFDNLPEEAGGATEGQLQTLSLLVS